MSGTALLAAAVLPLLLGLLGSRLAFALAAPGDGVLFRATVYVMAGAAVLHLTLTLLDFTGVPWSPLLLAALGAILYVLAWRLLPRRPWDARLSWAPGWGDGLALFALAASTLVALTAWTTSPDFIFHWGLKGRRFFFARGVDYAWLGRGWNWIVHPDYPNLLPETFAVTALIRGRFEVPAMLLITAVFFALMLAALREALRQGGIDGFTRQAGVALIALACGAFSMANLLPGGADGMMALALAAALPPLLRAPDRAGDFQIGVIAAFAAASKMEGLPLAAFLVLVQWGRRPSLGSALRAGLPPVLVALPWLERTLHHHLFLAANAGPLVPSRAPVITSAVLDVLRAPSWHGFLVAAFLPPLLLASRRVRPFAAVATLQLLFYFYVYFTAPAAVDPRAYILSNFARLGFHLVPASLAAALIAPWGSDGSAQRGVVSVTTGPYGETAPPLTARMRNE